MGSKQDYHRRPLPLRRNREDPMLPEPEWIGEIGCLIAAGAPVKGSRMLSAASDKGPAVMQGSHRICGPSCARSRAEWVGWRRGTAHSGERTAGTRPGPGDPPTKQYRAHADDFAPVEKTDCENGGIPAAALPLEMITSLAAATKPAQVRDAEYCGGHRTMGPRAIATEGLCPTAIGEPSLPR